MSTFSCPVVRVASVEDHPNANRLSLVRFEGLGYLCVSGKLESGEPRYKAGDLCVYIPSASVLPEWLLRRMDFWNAETNKGTMAGSDGNRVKPLRLRGIFSEGVLFPVGEWYMTEGNEDRYADYEPYPDGFIDVEYNPDTNYDMLEVHIGDDAADALGITKWTPPIPAGMAGEVANVPESAIDYEFERWENVTKIFTGDDDVTAVEKAHGTFMVLQYIPGLKHPEMFGETGCITVSSKGLGKTGLAFKNNEANDHTVYVQILRQLLAAGLERNLAATSKIFCDPIRIYGEVFGGKIQDLKYGLTAPVFRVFDVQVGRKFETRKTAENVCAGMGLEMLPVLYAGPFDMEKLIAVRDGRTMIGGDNVREGVVVTAADGSTHAQYGRKICKMISPDYLTRKAPKGAEATEYQ